MALLAGCALAATTSCTDCDGDGGQEGGASLVGLWEVTGEYDDELGTWDYEFGAQYDYVTITEFYANGTGYAQLTEEGAVFNNDFTYILECNSLTVTADGETMNYTIDKLTDTELVLSESYEYQGKTYTDLQVSKRLR